MRSNPSHNGSAVGPWGAAGAAGAGGGAGAGAAAAAPAPAPPPAPAAPAAPQGPTADPLCEGFDRILAAGNQMDVMQALLDGATGYAARCAVLVVKDRKSVV